MTTAAAERGPTEQPAPRDGAARATPTQGAPEPRTPASDRQAQPEPGGRPAGAAKTAAHRGGPRTPAGKRRSSRNAIRHGLTARDMVIPGIESDRAWQAHRKAITTDLGPRGAIEVLLAERVACHAWRLRRVVRFERDQIALELDQAVEGIRREDLLSERLKHDQHAAAAKALGLPPIEKTKREMGTWARKRRPRGGDEQGLQGMVGRVKGRLLRRRWGDAGRAGPEAAARGEAMVGEA